VIKKVLVASAVAAALLASSVGAGLSGPVVACEDCVPNTKPQAEDIRLGDEIEPEEAPNDDPDPQACCGGSNWRVGP